MNRGGAGDPRAAIDARTLTKLVRRAGEHALELWHAEPRTTPEEVTRALEEYLTDDLPARARRLPRISPGSTGETGDRTLVLSALDGADAWAARIPTWTIAVALVETEKATSSVVFAPAIDDLYVASGGELHWNGQKVPSDGASGLGGMVLALAGAKRRAPLRFARRRSPPLGSPAYHLALVARGSAEGAILDQPRLYEVVPGLALLEAAGGEALDPASGRVLRVGDLLAGSLPKRLIAARRGATATLLKRLGRG